MRAFITGLSGQDGSYLAEFLLEKGYTVIGLVRRSSTDNLQNIKHLLKNKNLILEYGDMTDQGCLSTIINRHHPDEVYNLAAMSYVPVSWSSPEYTYDVNTLGVVRILNAIKQVAHKKKIKFYQASTSEMFGKVLETPQTESTPFYPRSPYGVSKVAAHWTTINYRESYDLFAVCGILFNHESSRRGVEFVTRKITNSVARIKVGLQDKLMLGNLESQRDWGHSKDYVKAMWLMLQQDEPNNYVVGMNETHTVREFCDKAFSTVGLDYRDYVGVDPRFYRPAEVDLLLSNSNRIRVDLGWSPQYTFKDLVEEMVNKDLEIVDE